MKQTNSYLAMKALHKAHWYGLFGVYTYPALLLEITEYS